jgi:hypothetical protein
VNQCLRFDIGIFGVTDREVLFIREKLADHPLMTPVDHHFYNACVIATARRQ